ncbi:uncharacterized protein LOC123395028 isoform X2 [Hordeum vulgare subsp. vulgare]|uniref:uncharacterized protein LOC123395028 isoform X2 n=1 Tax=Hordeum vulgare subsp. vulgare TaxID=112509 RepID=UPI001B854FD5|nr:uncharacterized protein LOC123395028 isoform X2 [Hordeum vulgare subsp. vulgare]
MASPPPPPAPTTITDLSEDLLRAIFLRLPSLPSLIHAAYSHPAFRNAARSSRAFRRSFSELHPPDVLAFFSAKHMKLDRPSNGCWEIKTSDPDYKGYLCLINPSGGLAPYNPVTQALKIFVPAPTPQDRVATQGIEFLTLACDDDPKSSRVLCVGHDKKWTRMRVAVFSPRTMEWQVFPEAEALLLPERDRNMMGSVMRGFVCWAHWRGDCILKLNTATFQFSVMNPPTPLYASIKVCQTTDEKLCVVHMKETKLAAWLWITETDDGSLDGRWMMSKEFPLRPILKELAEDYSVEVEYVYGLLVAAIDGFVYMTIYYGKPSDPSEVFLSLCLETAETKKLFKGAFCYNDETQPYVMTWHPSLVQSKEASKTKVTQDNVVDDCPVSTEETSSLVTALQSFKQSMVNDGEDIMEDYKVPLMSKITTLDAQWNSARDRILRISA